MVFHDLSRPRIAHGTVTLSSRAVALALAHLYDPVALLARHLSGDWGALPLRYALLNENWLYLKMRVYSRYEIGGANVIFVTTDLTARRTTFICENENALLAKLSSSWL
jgi:hypothetical protein